MMRTASPIARGLINALSCLLPAVAITAQAASPKAPEFTHVSSADWINSKPLRLKSLRGKVVLIEFWAFECVNCLRSAPWVHSMQKRFGDRGLVIVGVHTPEFPQERVAANVRRAMAEQKVSHPVMMDNDYSYWNALNNKYWPAFYVVDAKGRIVADAIGEMHVGQPRALELEREIEAALEPPATSAAPQS